MRDRLLSLGGRLGILYCIAGFVLVFLGWNGAATYNRTFEQFPYLVSGGIAGLGLIVLGSALIIAQSLREIQRFQRDFEGVKARVAIGRSLENLASLMKGSITELQGMMGGEMGQSMQQLRQAAASGEGQMRATMDLAKEVGSNISRQQEMRRARGSMLFQEYKKKMGKVQAEAGAPAAPLPPTPERQKIAE